MRHGGDSLGGFNIIKAPSEVVLDNNSLEYYISQQERTDYLELLPEEPSEDCNAMLYILPSAFVELDQHIHWGKQTQENSCEQGGILIGSVYNDNESDSVCGVVQHVIPSTKPGNITYIQFTHDDWISMYKEFEDKYSNSGDANQSLKVIGWYHTHPNMPVRMSGIDKSTHIGFFTNFWQFSAIFNPQWGIWAVFSGKECKNCKGILFCHKNDIIGVQNRREIDNENKQPEVGEYMQPSLEGAFTVKRRTCAAVSVSESRDTGFTREWDSVYSQRKQVWEYTGARYNKRSMSQTYKGKWRSIADTCYYFPLNLNDIGNAEKYMISDALVRVLSSLKGNWEFKGEEAVAVFYQYHITNHYGGEFQGFSDVKFIESIERSNVQGFAFSSDIEGIIEYEDSINKEMIAVVYALENPGYQKLSEMCGNCNCVLWINVHNLNEFVFYVFSMGRDQKNFNIKNQDYNAYSFTPMCPKQIRIENLFNQIIQWQDNNGFIKNYYCIGTNAYNRTYQKTIYIEDKILYSFLQKINKYRAFLDDFWIIVSYRIKINSDINNGIVIEPLQRKIFQIWILKKCKGKIQRICLKNLSWDNEQCYSGMRKFAWIISNKDVSYNDIFSDELKDKLNGHLAVFCYNIKKKKDRLYRLL